jgi:hypothetical protein
MAILIDGAIHTPSTSNPVLKATPQMECPVAIALIGGQMIEFNGANQILLNPKAMLKTTPEIELSVRIAPFSRKRIEFDCPCEVCVDPNSILKAACERALPGCIALVR